jgi:hypothetical protein
MRAELFPIWAGGKAGYVYNVVFAGELVLDRRRDPDCDLARVLLARGLTGKVTLYDGNTGRPRTIIDIEKAAKVCVREDDRGMRFTKWTPYPDQNPRERCEGSPYSPEEVDLVVTMPSDVKAA